MVEKIIKQKLELVPINFADASFFVKKHHRTHRPPIQHKFSIAAAVNGEIVAVIIVGHPVARLLDDGFTVEVTRCCTNGYKNACSFLYSAAWRTARNLGYRKLVTYILASEPGTSLYASNFKLIAKVRGRSWNCPSRPLIDRHPTQNKLRFEIEL